ncbi:MAG: isochorismatase family cysteine hydrolase [Clostridia bacterium]
MKKRALLVIDMQNDFLGAEAPLNCEGGLAIIPKVQQAIANARIAQIPIVHVYQEHRIDGSDFGRELERSKPHCIVGSKGAEFVNGIDVLEEDYLLLKKRFSSFFHTELDLLLRGLKVEELVLCGIATDGCVRATAVDAHQLGYYFKLIKNGTAGAIEASHQDSIAYLCRLQKDVLLEVDDLLP